MLEVMGDVLDKPIFDRDGRVLGRADGIVVTLRDGKPPRLDAVLVGPVALAERVSERARQWAASLQRALGLPENPVVLPFTVLAIKHLHLEADVKAAATGLVVVEQKLQRWLARIPGSR